MTTLLDAPVTVSVEGSARIIRGLLVPYDKAALVGDRGPDGKVVVYRERFDRASLVISSMSIPLLQSHDESRPIGRATKLWHDDAGLQLEGELVGSSSELDGLRERIGHNLLTGLSVGFYSDPNLDEWEQATAPGGLPSVTRRGVVVKEASLCLWPAYPTARVTALRNRTENQRKSDEILGEYRARKDAERADLERFVAERKARMLEQHIRSERIKAEAAQLRRESERIDAELAKRARTRSY